MPWKGEKNPYRIWIAEVILQQTRVEQGWRYYLDFIDKFPDVTSLASADEKEVLLVWQGLGYYSRARNLHQSAKQIAERGYFPDTYDELLKLKGVGNYTASAIASFAYDLPFAVVDGNVTRILARYFGIKTPVDSTPGKKVFEKLAGELLDKNDPGSFNQAMMDFGAMVCKVRPNCKECPLGRDCKAFNTGKVNELPVKKKAISRRNRHLLFLVCRWKEMVYIEQRTARDIWKNLFQYPNIELTAADIPNGLEDLISKKIGHIKWKLITITEPRKQVLTHQNIFARFVMIDLQQPPAGQWIAAEANMLDNFAFPKIIVTFNQGCPKADIGKQKDKSEKFKS